MSVHGKALSSKAMHACMMHENLDLINGPNKCFIGGKDL